MSHNPSPLPESGDQDICQPVQVDGETVRVRGAGDLTSEDEKALAALVRAAKAKFVADAPEQVGVLQERLRLAHQARRAKEHQLDDIRRALCDAGFMEDDDPYSHADLANVIRQAGEATQAAEGRLRDRMRLVTDEKVAYVAGPTIELLCAEMNSLKSEVEAARKFAGEMRDFCSPHAVAADYADQLEQAMDRAKGSATNATADALAAEMHRRVKRMEELKRGDPARDHVYGEVLGMRGAIGIALGAQVPGGSADVAGIDYYEAWVARQEGGR